MAPSVEERPPGSPPARPITDSTASAQYRAALELAARPGVNPTDWSTTWLAAYDQAKAFDLPEVKGTYATMTFPPRAATLHRARLGRSRALRHPAQRREGRAGQVARLLRDWH
jgi:hypothetical protein